MFLFSPQNGTGWRSNVSVHTGERGGELSHHLREPEQKALTILWTQGWGLGWAGEGRTRCGKQWILSQSEKRVFKCPPQWGDLRRMPRGWDLLSLNAGRAGDADMHSAWCWGWSDWVLDCSSLQRLQFPGCTQSGVGRTTFPCEACQVNPLQLSVVELENHYTLLAGSWTPHHCLISGLHHFILGLLEVLLSMLSTSLKFFFFFPQHVPSCSWLPDCLLLNH